MHAVVVIISLGIGIEARAGGKVDWSQYVEPAGYTAPTNKPASSQEPVKTAAADKKPSRSVAKPHRAESRSKAKAPARKGRHR